ncbi:MAG: hypothetical protein GY798_33640 [Hyphomicrobiales bacterium]|nr:hypothetical protein [Hyphomicrobiales bacterium]
MKTLVIAGLSLGLCASVAWADEPVSPDEAEEIQAALLMWDCEGGEMEKERHNRPTYEVDDALCENGEFDFKLDHEFRIMVATRY